MMLVRLLPNCSYFIETYGPGPYPFTYFTDTNEWLNVTVREGRVVAVHRSEVAFVTP